MDPIMLYTTFHFLFFTIIYQHTYCSTVYLTHMPHMYIPKTKPFCPTSIIIIKINCLIHKLIILCL